MHTLFPPGTADLTDPSVAYMFRNRATPALKAMVDYAAKSLAERGSPSAKAFAAFAQDVAKWVNEPPVYMRQLVPNRPTVSVSPDGRINFKEVPRKVTMEDPTKPCNNAVDYVNEMARGLDYLAIAEGRKEPSTQSMLSLSHHLVYRCTAVVIHVLCDAIPLTLLVLLKPRRTSLLQQHFFVSIN